MQRSRVSQLPEEIRSELERRLVGSGFAGYSDLTDWLNGQGFEVSRSSVHRHGQEIERQIEKVRAATEQAKLLVEATDSEGEMSEAVLRMVQSRMFDVFLAAESDDLTDMSKAATALAKVSRADMAVRADRRKVLKDAADRQDKALKKHGITGDLADALRRALRE